MEVGNGFFSKVSWRCNSSCRNFTSSTSDKGLIVGDFTSLHPQRQVLLHIKLSEVSSTGSGIVTTPIKATNEIKKLQLQVSGSFLNNALFAERVKLEVAWSITKNTANLMERAAFGVYAASSFGLVSLIVHWNFDVPRFFSSFAIPSVRMNDANGHPKPCIAQDMPIIANPILYQTSPTKLQSQRHQKRSPKRSHFPALQNVWNKSFPHDARPQFFKRTIREGRLLNPEALSGDILEEKKR